MYAPAKYYTYSPEAKDFWAAQDEAYNYAKELANGKPFTCIKAYGWNWSIAIDNY